jgi:hypothetical protein
MMSGQVDKSKDDNVSFIYLSVSYFSDGSDENDGGDDDHADEEVGA